MKLKKIAALLLAGAMVVTSISYDAVIAEAKENSVSEDDGTDENYLNEDEEDVDEEDTDEEDIDEEDTDEEDSIYAYCDRSIALGESVTLTAQVQDSDGEPIDLDDYDFTYEWYRVTSSEEDGEEDVENDYEYLGSGREYFLDSVTEDDYMVGYECWIYDGDDVVAYTRYFLFPEDENGEYEDGEDEETTYLSCEVTVSALVGDSITLTPEFYDYENNLLDYTDPAYSYEWYKYYRFIEEGDTVSESAECVIDAVSEEDFFTEDNELLQYVCKVYKDGKVIAKTRVGIYNTKEVYTVTGYTAKAAQGGSITLTPKVTDYEGNTVDVEDAELKFYWSRYVDEGGQEYAGEGYKLTIDEVTSSDLYKDLNGNLLNNYYECTMIDYDHHGWTTSTVFYINEVCAHKKYKETVKKAATTKVAGTLSKTCTVCGNISTATIPKIASVTLTTTSYTYNGSAKKPTVTVKDSKGNKISSKYYTVKYTDNKNPGKATVQVTFKTCYSGTVKKTFTINPKGTSISSLTAKSKGFVVKWKAQTTQMTGYQVQYSTSSKFSSAKTLTAGKTKTSLTVSSLKSSKVYYVRVRTYKTVGGTKYYSAWSTAKKVTTKK